MSSSSVSLVGKHCAGDIQQLTAALRRHSWTSLMESRGDARLLEKVDEAEKLLRELKNALG